MQHTVEYFNAKLFQDEQPAQKNPKNQTLPPLQKNPCQNIPFQTSASHALCHIARNLFQIHKVIDLINPLLGKPPY